MNYFASVPITEMSRIGESRRAAVYLAQRAGFDQTQSGKVAVVVTEAARNILVHADWCVLILASDGISASWRFDTYSGLPSRHPAVIARGVYRDDNRGRDDVTVLVARPPEPAVPPVSEQKDGF